MQGIVFALKSMCMTVCQYYTIMDATVHYLCSTGW